MSYRHILAAFHAATWAITLDKYLAIRGFLELKAAGRDVDPAEVRAIVGAARPGEPRVADQIAVLPILGTIVPRGNMLAQSSGGVSAEMLTRALRQAMADPSVRGILLDFESPGGVIDGVEEFATEVYRARDKKPIYAVANGLAASAAYWIAASAERIFVTPSGMVGSIGVFSEHVDASKALEMEGVKPTLISAGKYKVDGNPYEPLTETARAHTQQIVDEAYGMFVRAVARGRGVSADVVRGGFGEGRVVPARAAVREGMADEVGTIDRALNALAYRIRQGAPTDKLAAMAQAETTEGTPVGGKPIGLTDQGDWLHSEDQIATAAQDGRLIMNGHIVTDEDLDAAEAGKAAEHAGLSASEQADLDRRRRRLRLIGR